MMETLLNELQPWTCRMRPKPSALSCGCSSPGSSAHCWGYEREQTRKAAGLRTHILVALGSALFVLAPLEAGMPPADVSRIVQGVAAGIGFIGAGAILKLTDARQIRGLTTAASIWTTAAVGMAAGLGRFGLAVLAAILALITLSVLNLAEDNSGNHNG